MSLAMLRVSQLAIKLALIVLFTNKRRLNFFFLSNSSLQPNSCSHQQLSSGRGRTERLPQRPEDNGITLHGLSTVRGICTKNFSAWPIGENLNVRPKLPLNLKYSNAQQTPFLLPRSFDSSSHCWFLFSFFF